MATYDLTPVQIPPVETKYRKICTALPVPESLPIFEELKKSEPRSMSGQPPIIWDHAVGASVWDKWATAGSTGPPGC